MVIPAIFLQLLWLYIASDVCRARFCVVMEDPGAKDPAEAQIPDPEDGPVRLLVTKTSPNFP